MFKIWIYFLTDMFTLGLVSLFKDKITFMGYLMPKLSLFKEQQWYYSTLIWEE